MAGWEPPNDMVVTVKPMRGGNLMEDLHTARTEIEIIDAVRAIMREARQEHGWSYCVLTMLALTWQDAINHTEGGE